MTARSSGIRLMPLTWQDALPVWIAEQRYFVRAASKDILQTKMLKLFCARSMKGRGAMPYDPRQRTSSDIEDEVAGWRGEEQIAATPRHHRPARHLRNTEQAVIAERLARQQAIDEARQSRATSSRRMPGQRSQYTKANSIQ